MLCVRRGTGPKGGSTSPEKNRGLGLNPGKTSEGLPGKCTEMPTPHNPAEGGEPPLSPDTQAACLTRCRRRGAVPEQAHPLGGSPTSQMCLPVHQEEPEF